MKGNKDRGKRARRKYSAAVAVIATGAWLWKKGGWRERGKGACMQGPLSTTNSPATNKIEQIEDRREPSINTRVLHYTARVFCTPFIFHISKRIQYSTVQYHPNTPNGEPDKQGKEGDHRNQRQEAKIIIPNPTLQGDQTSRVPEYLLGHEY